MIKQLPLIFVLILFFSCTPDKKSGNELDLTGHITAQLAFALDQTALKKDTINQFPRTTENGELKLVRSRDWTSGFFAGNLWMVYEMTGDEKWKNHALEYTLPLEKEKWNDGTHDMGFKMYCSFGKAWKVTGDTTYRNILVQSARTLTTRFNPAVGCIRSWDHNTDKWDFPVIIDNMMNLELLMWAFKETGDETFKTVAVTHAMTTMKNHFREDNSSFHVVDYHPETGVVENRHTHQGYAHESAWARGQAWGLYGYTMMYRETGMDEFLEQAEKIADYLLNQKDIREGRIPYWDFNAPGIPEEPYDASAGAIIAAALYELSGFAKERGGEYLEVADKLLNTMSSPDFLADPGTNQGFLLKHSTGHKPNGSEVDVPLVYADYYFLESLIRKANRK